jgi:hypothetical protein
MKKITAILLLSIYSLTTLGIGIRQFYCCGKLKSTALTLVQEVKEKCGDTGSMKGCCKTTFKSLKVKGSHLTTGNAVSFNKYFTELQLPAPVTAVALLHSSVIVTANTSNAPPARQNVPAYILHCAYLI